MSMHLKRIAVSFLAVLAFPACADSLYRASTFQPLTSDLRQRHVGDLLTVVVSENASASSVADTTTSRAANVGVDVRGISPNRSVRVGTANELDGRGRTEREGKVLAQLTVVIKEVLPSGDLVVSGEQLLEINNESQRIAVEGRVRQQDVSDTNVVLSSRIANARIHYAGQGDLSDHQRPSWWQRFLTKFGI
jgi:flagellar L-ring protein precursor FlgH